MKFKDIFLAPNLITISRFLASLFIFVTYSINDFSVLNLIMLILELILNNFIYLILIILLFLSFRNGVVIVPQQKSYLIERFGKYRKTLNSGLNFITLFFKA